MSVSSASAAIEISDLVFHYGARSNAPTLRIADWTVQRGERVFIQGPSGSGKSTLLNLIAGTLMASEGQVSVMGQNLSALSARKRDRFRARHIGVVFQQFNLISYLTVKQNIEAAVHFASGDKREANARIIPLFQHLQLPTSLLEQRADTLSVGQQQRVAIARALINQPEVLIVDEPTSALDSAARDGFMQVLISSCEENSTTLLFVSHDASLASYFTQQTALTDLNQAEGAVC